MKTGSEGGRKTILIVAPRKADFDYCCRKHFFKSTSPDYNLVHINNKDKLLGRVIREADRIIWFNVSAFTCEVFEEIRREIKLRSVFVGKEFI